MAKPGRKPKPTELKKLAGNPGKRPLNESEPGYPPAETRVPRGKLPEEGQKLWKALAPHLAAAGVLKVTDLAALEMLCAHYAVSRMALEDVLERGSSIEGVHGEKKNPAASVFRENAMAFRLWATEFGLTPSSRVRIKAEPVVVEKSLAELLFEGVEDE